MAKALGSLLPAAALSLAVFLVQGPAEARCLGEWARVVGGDAPMPINGRVLLEGFSYKDTFDDLGARSPVLRHAKETVPLKVVERRAGEVRNLRQYLLEPTRPLVADRTYRLDFNGRPNGEALEVKTGAGSDTTAPKWLASPTLKSSERHELGCGPSAGVIFTVPAEDDSGSLFAHVELTRTRDRKTTSGFVLVQNKEIGVGRSMCSGMWDLETGASYEVRLALIDSAGQSAKTVVPALRIVAP